MVRSALCTLALASTLGAQTYVNERTHGRLTVTEQAYTLETRAWLPDGNVGRAVEQGKVTTVGLDTCLWANTALPACSGGPDQEQRSWFGQTWWRQRPLFGRYVRADGLVLVLESNGALRVAELQGEWWNQRDVLCITLPTTGTLCQPLGVAGPVYTWGPWRFSRQ